LHRILIKIILVAVLLSQGFGCKAAVRKLFNAADEEQCEKLVSCCYASRKRAEPNASPELLNSYQEACSGLAESASSGRKSICGDVYDKFKVEPAQAGLPECQE
jgi:hypothetical protein